MHVFKGKHKYNENGRYFLKNQIELLGMKKILSEMKNLLMRLTTNKPHCRRKKNSELEGIAI